MWTLHCTYREGREGRWERQEKHGQEELGRKREGRKEKEKQRVRGREGKMRSVTV